MPPRITLEVAVTSADEAVAAYYAGADRLELCSALEVGGVTPAFGTRWRTLVATGMPVCVLFRPRAGGFGTTVREFDGCRLDVAAILQEGTAGLVFGFLADRDGHLEIDRRCRPLAQWAKGKAVFHRAFDFLPDLPAALEQLIELGFRRVLTSGGAPTALEGADVIAALVKQAAGRIEILPGGGVTPENVVELVRRTGCDQVHGSFRSPVVDPTLAGNPALAAGMGGGLALDPAKVAAARAALDRYSAGG